MSGRVILTGSSTGGHLYPLIAIAQELGSDRCLFIGSERKMDVGIVQEYGFRHLGIPVTRFHPLRWCRALWRSRRYIREFRPSVVVGSGGYVTVPVLVMAWVLRVPILLLEQNIIPGRVTRFMSKVAKKICVSFDQNKGYLPSEKMVTTGNPLRKYWLKDAAYKAFSSVRIQTDRVLLVLGGSQGSLAINRFLEANYEVLMGKGYTVIHLVGRAYYKSHYDQDYYTMISAKDGLAKVYVMPYFENMAYLYGLSDVVLARAGATTLAELSYYQIKAILVPYPYATEDHQRSNAEAIVQQKMAIMLDESLLSWSALSSALLQLRSVWSDASVPDCARMAVCDQIDQLMAGRL